MLECHGLNKDLFGGIRLETKSFNVESLRRVQSFLSIAGRWAEAW